MMTDAQVEAAARELCRLRGVDPESWLPHGATPDEFGAVLALLLHSPAWKLAACEVRAAEQLAEAMRVGREAAP